jgi:predicted kinase
MENTMGKVIIMRGLPGSGKSTMADRLAEENGGVIFSTDNYFMHNGNYLFDASKLGAAHAWNQRKYQEALERGEEYVIVDNTNTTMREMRPYIKLAGYLGYSVEIMEPDNPERFHVDLCFVRNTHGVPFAAIENMLNRWQDIPQGPYTDKELEN